MTIEEQVNKSVLPDPTGLLELGMSPLTYTLPSGGHTTESITYYGSPNVWTTPNRNEEDD